jgi:thioredoxin-like negative regulator of GroEL
VAYAYHELNEHDKELEAAGRPGDGMTIDVASALAGRGDSGAVRRLVESLLEPPNPGRHELEAAECAALELRAHGGAATAAPLLVRTAVAGGPDGAADSGGDPCLWNLFSASYYAGRLDEARVAYARKAAKDTSDVKARAALAAIAARRGDQAEVDSQERWLSAHRQGLADLGLARVAALQGRREDAVRLLQRAMGDALERHYLHIDPDFESLREYPPYRELLRPKG